MSQHSSSRKEILLVYERNIHQAEERIKKLKKEKKIIAVTRLITAITGITISWYFWPMTIPFIAAIILFSALMIFLVFLDADRTSGIRNGERLIRINEHEVMAMTGNLYLSDYEDGQVFADPMHAYASDLDLFGPSSLFHVSEPLPCRTIQNAAGRLDENTPAFLPGKGKTGGSKRIVCKTNRLPAVSIQGNGQSAQFQNRKSIEALDDPAVR